MQRKRVCRTLLAVTCLLATEGLWATEPPPHSVLEQTSEAAQQGRVYQTNVLGGSSTINDSPHLSTSGAGLLLYADFLYYFVTEGGLDYAIVNKFTGISGTEIGGTDGIDGKTSTPAGQWNPGLRWGLGYNFAYDGWDMNLCWTYVSANSVSTADSLSFPSSTVIAIWDVYDPLNGASSAQANWRLCYNTLDLELGRAYFVGKALALRPFFGLRGAFIYQTLHLSYAGLVLTGTKEGIVVANLQNTQKFTGGGGRVGFDSTWFFNKHWSFYARGSASLVWAYDDIAQDERVTDTLVGAHGKLLYITRDHGTVQGNLEIGLGAAYDYYFSTGYHLGCSAGWDFIDWFSFNELRPYAGSSLPGKGSNSSNDNDLQMTGFALRVRFDF